MLIFSEACDLSGFPTSVCGLCTVQADGLEARLVLQSPHLSVFAFQLPPQYG